MSDVIHRYKRTIKEPVPEKVCGFETSFLFEGVNYSMKIGEYNDGRLATFQIDCDGSEQDCALVRAFGDAISIGLQFGAPIDSFVHTFNESQITQKKSVVQHCLVQEASSWQDAAFQIIENVYCPQNESIKPKPVQQHKGGFRVIDGGRQP